MPPANSPYYASQRPMTPTPDYNMAAVRGMRPPTPAYGSMPVQQRIRGPHPSQMMSSASDPSSMMMNNNPMGLQSTPPPPSMNPR